ncbi:MAG TPA: hypothetical protein VGA92_09430 [Candidatus Nitrosotenuis sp.]|jgi:hypothetical protein
MDSQATESFLKKSKTEMALIVSIISITVIALAASTIGPEETNYVFAIQSTILAGTMVAFSVTLIKKTKSRQELYIVLAFTAFAALWFVAGQIWNYNGIILQIDQFPSIADYLWLLGYVALFVFAVQIIRPVKNALSKKLIFSICALSASFLIPSIIATVGNNALANVDVIVAMLYPISDAIVLVPIICAIIIFKNTKENNFWPLFVAIILTVITDTIYLFLEVSGSYYTGHLVWLGYGVANTFFVYGLYKQNQIMKKTTAPIFEQLRSEADVEKLKTTISIPIVISTAVIVFVLSVVQIFGFGNLSVNEITLVQPIFYVSVSLILALSVVVSIIGKKYLSVKSELEKSRVEKPRLDYEVKMSPQIEVMQNRLENMGRWGRFAVRALFIISLVVGAAIAFYLYSSLEQTPTILSSGRYLIEGLDGQVLDTWAIWYLAENESLHVSIVNSGLLPSDKISSIQNAIISEKTIESVELTSGVYFEGWKGALAKAGLQKTTTIIPQSFVLEETDAASGEIVITLSSQKPTDGVFGSTRSIADVDSHQLLKSFVTIYDVKNLDNDELASITRHEMGHALGLTHSTGSEIEFYRNELNSAFISDCHIESLVLLYNEQDVSMTCQ